MYGDSEAADGKTASTMAIQAHTSCRCTAAPPVLPSVLGARAMLRLSNPGPCHGSMSLLNEGQNPQAAWSRQDRRKRSYACRR